MSVRKGLLVVSAPQRGFQPSTPCPAGEGLVLMYCTAIPKTNAGDNGTAGGTLNQPAAGFLGRAAPRRLLAEEWPPYCMQREIRIHICTIFIFILTAKNGRRKYC